MNPGQNGNDPDVPERPASDDSKAWRPAEVQPRALAASRGWSLTKKVLRIVVGVFLLLLGLAALFTPFTPGSWLALVGLEFLGLRVLLRDWLCVRARARPQSRFWRVTCRVFSLGRRDATKRSRWRRWFHGTPAAERDEACDRRTKDV